jgi:RHS repeat-associated protein
MQMQLSSDVRIPDGLLAANAQLAENSHQGSATSTHTLHQGFYFAISSTSLGISGSLYDGRTGCRYTGKERDAESGLDNFGARYFGSNMGRFMSPDWSDAPDTVPYAEFENPQTLNLYSYARNSPLVYNDPDGHDVRVCDNNGQCNTVSNDAYSAAQKGNNGSLNAPTLDQVGMNGNGSGQFNSTAITDGSGNSVGSATYVSNGGADYYANRNGINQIAQAGATVGSVRGIASFYGASALIGAGVAFSPVMGAGAALTTLGIPSGLTPGAVVGGFTLTAHAVEQAQARGVTLGEIEEAVEGVAKSNPQNGYDSVQRFYTSTCEVRVNKITGTIVTVISKIKR